MDSRNIIMSLAKEGKVSFSPDAVSKMSNIEIEEALKKYETLEKERMNYRFLLNVASSCADGLNLKGVSQFVDGVSENTTILDSIISGCNVCLSNKKRTAIILSLTGATAYISYKFLKDGKIKDGTINNTVVGKRRSKKSKKTSGGENECSEEAV